ncbi:MAG TPA: hypothetical protein VFW96_03850, partial [Thermomicrobiales bacterium]|nr:hypothetical protein [Thermomicrobiales bacterium]
GASAGEFPLETAHGHTIERFAAYSRTMDRVIERLAEKAHVLEERLAYEMARRKWAEAQLEAGFAHRTDGGPVWAHLPLAERRRHVEEARAELGYAI